MPRAKVISPVSVYGEPRQIGDELEVDDQTFANLARKGRLAEADAVKTENREKELTVKRKTR